MNPTLSFVVPGAPVPKARGRVMRPKGQKVRTITPEKTVNFEATVKLVAASKRPAEWPMHCEYLLSIHAVQPSRRGDLDNIVKSIGDACNTVLWADDVQVADLQVTRSIDTNNPRTEVTVIAHAVPCETCGAATFQPVEKRCPVCAALLEAKRARRRRP